MLDEVRESDPATLGNNQNNQKNIYNVNINWIQRLNSRLSIDGTRLLFQVHKYDLGDLYEIF